MANVQDVAVNTDTIRFDFTNNQRNAGVQIDSVNANYIINIDGSIFTKKQHNKNCVVAIVGGDNTFAHKKDKSVSSGYYWNELQKTTVHQILLNLARINKYNARVVDGNNDYLNIVTQAIFENYRN